MPDDDDNIFKLEDYKNRIKKQTSSSQEEIEKILLQKKEELLY